MKELAVIEIPLFVEDVLMSSQRQTKYYEQSKSNQKKIPQKYLTSDFGWKPLKTSKTAKLKMVWTHIPTTKPVIANPRSAGTAKYKRISGNDFYAGFGSHFDRMKMVNAIQNSLRPHLKKLKPFDKFPLIIEAEHHNIIGQGNWDSDNKFYAYKKVFQDLLTHLFIIPDDSIRYITKAPEPIFVPVEKSEDRKFVFKFYHDTRDCITKHPFYNGRLLQGKEIK
jgi:hypothetical protein